MPSPPPAHISRRAFALDLLSLPFPLSLSSALWQGLAYTPHPSSAGRFESVLCLLCSFVSPYYKDPAFGSLPVPTRLAFACPVPSSRAQMNATSPFCPQSPISIPVPQYPRLSLSHHRPSILHGACHPDERAADLMTRTLQAHRSADSIAALPRLASARSASFPPMTMPAETKAPSTPSPAKKTKSSATESARRKGAKQWRSGFVNPLDENGKKRKGRPPRAAYHAAGSSLRSPPPRSPRLS